MGRYDALSETDTMGLCPLTITFSALKNGSG